MEIFFHKNTSTTNETTETNHMGVYLAEDLEEEAISIWKWLSQISLLVLSDIAATISIKKSKNSI
ncbi:hypothetical protein F3J23_14675 [Chryseobacterium sp. Tr-659]|uniref:hypothetical protein n=1 Tax=Chryseobacterium sp. Tr-659 TaxID=2608340 RepID=UPI001423C041|nr:hypothetical protein [Chryseobacterium sp. Tr-659]NIF06691.1 hypothetical protein [Chryseobacterium sp. Tr-659]